MVFGTLGSLAHTWQVTINGTDYPAYLDGFLSFDTDPFLAPPLTGATSGTVAFSTPFTMDGRLRGSSGAQGSGSVLSDVLLTGNGTAFTGARPIVPNAYLVNGGVTYEFGAATPEPATLLLMGTGLGRVAAPANANVNHEVIRRVFKSRLGKVRSGPKNEIHQILSSAGIVLARVLRTLHRHGVWPSTPPAEEWSARLARPDVAKV